jgi:hypothetical protein
MTVTIAPRPLHQLCLFVSVLLLLPLSAYPQTTLTGAIQFSTSSTGAASGGLLWNTLGGDTYYDLWLAGSPDATLPVNGPSDAEARIAVPLEAGNSYTFYIFGQPGPGTFTGFNGLNLFFDGHNSIPGLSAFGMTNGSVFLPNSSATLTLQGTSVTGSGSTAYSADGVVVALTGYEWHTPEASPGDVCQAFAFSPAGGDVLSFFGSFTLHAFPAAALSLSQTSGSPGTTLTLAGSGFAPTETVTIHAGRIGSVPISTVVTDASGSFTVTARVPQHAYGPMDFFAVGQTSGKIGTTTFFVTPGLIMNPGSGLPGGTTAAQGLGFGAGETVSVYWDSPRQLLGTATANGEGSFSGSGALTITIPANASPGLNAVIGIGQTTNAIGIGKIEVK